MNGVMSRYDAICPCWPSTRRKYPERSSITQSATRHPIRNPARRGFGSWPGGGRNLPDCGRGLRLRVAATRQELSRVPRQTARRGLVRRRGLLIQRFRRALATARLWFRAGRTGRRRTGRSTSRMPRGSFASSSRTSSPPCDTMTLLLMTVLSTIGEVGSTGRYASLESASRNRRFLRVS